MNYSKLYKTYEMFARTCSLCAFEGGRQPTPKYFFSSCKTDKIGKQKLDPKQSKCKAISQRIVWITYTWPYDRNQKCQANSTRNLPGLFQFFIFLLKLAYRKYYFTRKLAMLTVLVNFQWKRRGPLERSASHLW